jgi:hypothetical protein
MMQMVSEQEAMDLGWIPRDPGEQERTVGAPTRHRPIDPLKAPQGRQELYQNQLSVEQQLANQRQAQTDYEAGVARDALESVDSVGYWMARQQVLKLMGATLGVAAATAVVAPVLMAKTRDGSPKQPTLDPTGPSVSTDSPSQPDPPIVDHIKNFLSTIPDSHVVDLADIFSCRFSFPFSRCKRKSQSKF